MLLGLTEGAKQMADPQDGVAPPSDDQRVNQLPAGPSPAESQRSSDSERNRDAPPLRDGYSEYLNDGIADQTSRRSHRGELVKASFYVLGILMLNLTIVVIVLTYAFCRALAPESVAKASVAELVKWVDQAASSPGASLPSSSSSAPSKIAPASPPGPIKTQAQAMKIEAKIFGEVRDSMFPLVALVSILTLAVTVILGTMLKASFARPVVVETASDEKEYPVPVLQALKELADSIKALFKG